MRIQRPARLIASVTFLVAGLFGQASPAQAAPGGREWLAQYSGPGASDDSGYSVVASPDGTRVYVTGPSHGNGSGFDYATIAYRASTGVQVWVARYDDPSRHGDYANAIAVSPNGSRVFVTGGSYGATSLDYATIAYRASDGKQLWVSRYDGPGKGDDQAFGIAVASGGTRVLVTGSSTGLGSGEDFATVSYEAATGHQQWVKRYDGPAGGADFAKAIVVNPKGTRAFVTGASTRKGHGLDYFTVAYATAGGAQKWSARYDDDRSKDDSAHAVAVNAAGTRVFVTGGSDGPTTGGGVAPDYATVAYAAGSGTRQWVARYDGPSNGADVALGVALAPDGSQVFVTGSSEGGTSDFATISYATADGAQAWEARYDGASLSDIAYAIGVSPDGSQVYVTGRSETAAANVDFATLSYDAVAGTQRWVSTYDGPAGAADVPLALVVDPKGARVYVTGRNVGTNTGTDFATIAYQA